MTTAVMELASRARSAGTRRFGIRMFADVWADFNRYREARRAVLELRSLADWQLRDIGVHRSEIASVVYGGPDNTRRSRAA